MTPKKLIEELKMFLMKNPELANKQMQIWVDEINGTRSVHVKLNSLSFHGSIRGNKPAVFGNFDINNVRDYS